MVTERGSLEKSGNYTIIYFVPYNNINMYMLQNSSISDCRVEQKNNEMQALIETKIKTEICIFAQNGSVLGKNKEQEECDHKQ